VVLTANPRYPATEGITLKVYLDDKLVCNKYFINTPARIDTTFH
jgi:hypothetical protein